jgi:hypothetical protein
MARSSRAYDCAGRSAYSGALTSWSLTRAQNETTHRNERNSCETLRIHKSILAVEFNRASQTRLHGSFKKT